MVTIANQKELDKEWIELLIEARNLGISVDEIKDFLKDSSWT